MKSPCVLDVLEALARGDLDPDAARALAEHAVSCNGCAEELRWLREERRRFVARRSHPTPSPAASWASIERRLQRPAPAWHAWRGLAPWAVAAALVASFTLFLLPGPRPARTDGPTVLDWLVLWRSEQPAVRALDHAEHEYQQAAAVLEARYRAVRARRPMGLPALYDRRLERMRLRLAQESQLAPFDPDARVRLIDGYATYVQSLEEALDEEMTR